MTFSFIQNPTGQAMTDSDLVTSALDQPMSLGSTFWDQTKGGVLESFGLGTAIRSLSAPEAAPPESDSAIVNTLSAVNRAIAPETIVRRIAGTVYDGSPSITEDQYKQSPSFRKDIPWQQGMTEERAAALAEQDDTKQVRAFYGQKRPVTAFFGNLAGQAVDPINYIPIAGEAVAGANIARFGRIAGRALTSSLDAAANTAIAGLSTASERGQLGDDVSWQSTVSQIAMAALIGGAFGAIHGRFGRSTPAELRAEAETKLATLDNVQASRVSLNDALDGMIRDGDVKLSTASSGYADNIAAETARLADAYDRVRANPTGPATDPLVTITPADIEGTMVARGAFKDINETEFSRRGWGLVKILWKHGEESNQEPALRIAKDDVLALPEVVRDYEPSSVSADGSHREWRVERNGRTIVYADTLIGDQRHTVTAYVQSPDHADASNPLSEKRKPAATGSSDESVKPVGDTAQQPLSSSAGGQSLPASRSIAQPASVDNAVPTTAPDQVVTEAAQRVGKPEGTKALAEQYRVNPETGDFPEFADIEQLRTEGRLTEDDLAALDDADEIMKTANAYGEALKSFASCVI